MRLIRLFVPMVAAAMVLAGCTTAATSATASIRATTASTTSNASIDTRAWYTLTPRVSGLRVDVRGGTAANGVAVQQFTSNATKSQYFRFVANGDGTFRVVSALSGGRVLDVSGGSTANGARVQTWTWGGVNQQRWIVQKAATSGFVTLKPRHATSSCLDVPGGSRSTGVQLQIFTCNGTISQQYALTKVGVVKSGDVMTFRLPFQSGQSWQAGAPHSTQGNNSGPRGSVDFGPGGSTNRKVLAIAGGTVFKYTQGCPAGQWYLGINHGDGWVSTYYHLSNVQSSLVGTTVAAGAYLGDAARAVNCGGSTSFNHVHLTILKDNVPYAIDGLPFSGMRVHSSGMDYHGRWTNAAGAELLRVNGLALCCLTAP